ncbi:hypothetical protein P5V15_004825 [Pogonomyrmex californicus]
MNKMFEPLSNFRHGRRKRLVKFGYAGERRKFSFVSHGSHLIVLVYSLYIKVNRVQLSSAMRQVSVGFEARICSDFDYSTRNYGRDERDISDVERKFIFDTAEIFNLDVLKNLPQVESKPYEERN